jgi:hypothetical protein
MCALSASETPTENTAYVSGPTGIQKSIVSGFITQKNAANSLNHRPFFNSPNMLRI